MLYPVGRKRLNYIDKIVKLKDQMLKRHLILLYFTSFADQKNLLHV
jgi:hypothetical protein